MGFLDPATHAVEYHSGGQGPILHYRAGPGTCDWYQPTNFPVGVMDIDDAGDGQILNLDPGDLLVLLSDGVYEYHNAAGEQFGEDRVAEIVTNYHGDSMQGLRRILMTAVAEFAVGAPQEDDITMILIKRSGAD